MKLSYNAKTGNAGCTKCGLRASSKNVTCRSVFCIWPDDEKEYLLQMFENCIAVKSGVEWNDKKIDMIGVRPTVTRANDKGGGCPDIAELVGSIVKSGLTPEEARAVLCDHHWVQDKGTATV